MNVDYPARSPTVAGARLAVAAIVFLFALGGAAAALAGNDRTYFSPDSEIYDHLRAVRLESGLSIPWSSRSLTAGDVRRLLEPVNYGVLSAAGRRAVERIEEMLERRPIYRSDREWFAFDLRPEIGLEAYLGTAERADGWPDSDQWPDAGDGTNVGDWLYEFSERTPLLSMPLEAWLGRTLYARAELDLQPEYFVALDPEKRLNVPMGLDEIDYIFPTTSFALIGGDHWFAQLGRDQLRWGSGRTGTMVLSDAPDYYDFLRFGIGVKHFRYTSLVVDHEPWFDDDFAEWEELSGDSFEQRIADSHERDLAKTMYMHRFEFDIASRLQLAVVEGMMYGERRGELRFWNPLSMLHNFFELEYGSAYLGLEANWNPWRFMNLYGEFGMTQIGTQFKGEEIPASLGGMFGVEGVLPAGEGYFTGFAEYARTNPWYGIREHPLRTWHSRRRVISNYLSSQNISARRIVTQPTGYAWGPDSSVFGGGLGYSVPGRYSVELALTLVARGENRIDSPYEESMEAAELRTPSGEVERRIGVDLGASWTPFRDRHGVAGGLELGMNAAVVAIDSYLNIPGNDVFEMQFSPSIVLRF